MQKTRQKILEYLRAHDSATVDELSEALGDLTAVTVRHHLDILRSEGLIGPPEVQHRDSPGRPKYVYSLTEKAHSMFPRNLRTLTGTIIEELKSTLNEEQVNVFFEGVADRMAADALPPGESASIEERLDRVAEHLTGHGYEARWERTPEGYVLHTSNCPYTGVAEAHDELCQLDMRYISRLLGTLPRRMTHMREEEPTCSYLVPLTAVR